MEMKEGAKEAGRSGQIVVIGGGAAGMMAAVAAAEQDTVCFCWSATKSSEKNCI